VARVKQKSSKDKIVARAGKGKRLVSGIIAKVESAELRDRDQNRKGASWDTCANTSRLYHQHWWKILGEGVRNAWRKCGASEERVWSAW
jgi:hypothetical protein